MIKAMCGDGDITQGCEKKYNEVLIQHGDDFILAERKIDLDWFDVKINGKFDSKHKTSSEDAQYDDKQGH